MKKTKDHFSKQANLYAKFRPTYPKAMYDYLLSQCPQREQLWDCGTGNGQVAQVLASYFRQVQATDISQRQLDQATPLPNVHYQCCRGEQTPFADNSFDLITVAQAIHWFDFHPFFEEVRRVGKAGSCLAVWGYGLLRIDDAIDPLIKHFYTQTIGPFWAPERRHIDQHYTSIPYPFPSIQKNDHFGIKDRWTLDQLAGYLNTWSSVQSYIRQHQSNPVELLIQQIKALELWTAPKEVVFPIFLSTMTIDK